MKKKKRPVEESSEDKCNIEIEWTIQNTKKNTKALKNPVHYDLKYTLSNLNTGACIHGYNEECIEVSEDVPVDDKNAGMKPHEKKVEEVTACQGDEQVRSRKENHDIHDILKVLACRVIHSNCVKCLCTEA